MKLRLVCTNLKSRSAKEVAKGLTKKVKYRVFRSLYPKMKRVNIKYGGLVDKVTQYEWFKSQSLPALDFTTSQSEAKTWANEKQAVFCRTLTKSSEGKGIAVATSPEEVVYAPVYTKYKKKKTEFRVHLFRHVVVAVLEKRIKTGWLGEKNTQIRNTKNGYVFCQQNVKEPEGIRELAIKASYVTSSDFAGVDIGYNEKKNELFIIEVNSAPGITGSNVEKYTNTILTLYGN